MVGQAPTPQRFAAGPFLSLEGSDEFCFALETISSPLAGEG